MALAFILNVTVSPPAYAEYRQPPNSRIAIELDDRFTLAPRFSGFIDVGSGSSFVMIEMPGAAYRELKAMPDHSERLAQRGLRDAEVSPLEGREGEYVYFTARQTQRGVDYAKFILIFREKSRTAFITVNVPQTALDEGLLSRAGIETMLSSAKISDTPGEDRKLFELGYLGPFQLAASIAGTAEMYNTSGEGPEQGLNRLASEPSLMVAPSLDQRAIGNIEQVAKMRFKSLAGINGREIREQTPISIGGLDGYRILADGTTTQNNSEVPITALFIMLAGKPGGYYILFGTAPHGQKDEILPELEKVMASFTLSR